MISSCGVCCGCSFTITLRVTNTTTSTTLTTRHALLPQVRNHRLGAREAMREQYLRRGLGRAGVRVLALCLHKPITLEELSARLFSEVRARVLAGEVQPAWQQTVVCVICV